MKIVLLRLFLSVLSLIIGKYNPGDLGLYFYIISYLIAGYDVLWSAITNIIKGEVFDENFLMFIATIGAFVISEYSEGIFVMIFYQTGELFHSYALSKSRNSISDLMNIKAETANVLLGDKIVTVDVEEVKNGSIIVIKAGEKVPLDAVIISGDSLLDTSCLTGESLPREVSVGDKILSGSINTSGTIQAEVLSEYKDSTVNKILELVENASDRKGKNERFITKFSRYYTPSVVIAAVLLAIVGPIVTNESISTWLYRACSFLVVSCPCALVISIPMSFFGTLGAGAKKGILIKGSNYVEVFAKCETMLFDKTGTLTKGVFKVKEIETTSEYTQDELIKYASYAEYYSNHPISKSLLEYYNKDIDINKIKDTVELAGFGVKSTIDGKTVLAGNVKLMKENNINNYLTPKTHGTVVHIALDNNYMGYVLIADELKENIKETIANIKARGINKTIMLTGDSSEIAKEVAATIGLDEVYSSLLPQDKVSKCEEIIKNSTTPVAFVGDGINDAPSLAIADVSIAMGALGSDAAIEAADLVIMSDDIAKVNVAIDLSRRTLVIVKENISFALGVKLTVLILTMFGVSNMWQAVFADVGVSVLAILNALRILSVKRYK